MKRRTFGLLSGSSMLALMAPKAPAWADAADFAALSKTTLTPFGAERAANADGSIPAWTGGYAQVPAGWVQGKFMPDFFADDAVVVTIDASNMSQYADRLTDGVKYMMQNWGFSIKVYPTHRTATAPQAIYDNIAQNATRAQVNPEGGRLGFSGAHGGIPFPIPDSDPTVAGAQIMWNHNCRWQGYQQSLVNATFVVSGGGAPQLTAGIHVKYLFSYYDPNGTDQSTNGVLYRGNLVEYAPATAIGGAIDGVWFTNPNVQPDIGWELLPGQGRVRKTPELSYDTPDSFTNGVSQFDEVWGLNGALNEYDWKLVGKKEMYIPYNNNKMNFATRDELAGPLFFNPDIVRWELHRVWVVDATLHPGERNVIPHRRFYVDEDTWVVGLGDCWDGSGNLWKVESTYNSVQPELPGTVRLWSVSYNLQSKSYAMMDGTTNDPGFNIPIDFNTPISMRVFDPNVMAADASY